MSFSISEVEMSWEATPFLGQEFLALDSDLNQSNLITHPKKKATKRKPFEAKFDLESQRTAQEFSNGHLKRMQKRDEDGHLISNDLADYMLVKCQLCNLHKPLTKMRSHTKTAHNINITEYKAKFGGNLKPLEPVYHRCGVCSKKIFLDADAIAVHLRSGGHPRITFKDYSDTFMVDTRPSGQDGTVPILRTESHVISHRVLGGLPGGDEFLDEIQCSESSTTMESCTTSPNITQTGGEN